MSQLQAIGEALIIAFWMGIGSIVYSAFFGGIAGHLIPTVIFGWAGAYLAIMRQGGTR